MDTFWKKNKKAIGIFLIIVLAFSLGLGWRWLEGTPHYALYKIGASLKNREADTFLVYVDLDSILQKQAAESVSTLLKSAASDKLLGKIIGSMGEFKITLNPGTQAGLTSLVREELKKYLRNPDNPTLPSAFLLLSVARFNTRGDQSLVTLKKDKDQLRLAMSRSGGIWRVVELNPEDTQRLIKTYLLK